MKQPEDSAALLGDGQRMIAAGCHDGIEAAREFTGIQVVAQLRHQAARGVLIRRGHVTDGYARGRAAQGLPPETRRLAQAM